MTDLVLALIEDQIVHADLSGVAAAEERLHERLRIRREREQPCDDVRLALASRLRAPRADRRGSTTVGREHRGSGSRRALKRGLRTSPMMIDASMPRKYGLTWGHIAKGAKRVRADFVV